MLVLVAFTPVGAGVCLFFEFTPWGSVFENKRLCARVFFLEVTLGGCGACSIEITPRRDFKRKSEVPEA